MQAIVLAAGFGQRLRPITDTKPKCLVEVGKVSLLENILGNLAEVGVSKVWIVTGYLGEKVEEAIGKTSHGMDIGYIHNTAYQTTNNIYSMYLALQKVEDDFIMTECDLFYRSNILKKLLEHKRECTIMTSPFNPDTMDGTVITKDKDGKAFQMLINRHQKRMENLSPEGLYKTVNIYYMGRDFAKEHLLPAIDLYMKTYDKNSYYELVIGSLLYYGVSDIDLIEVSETDWAEIDDREDLKRAEERFGV